MYTQQSADRVIRSSDKEFSPSPLNLQTSVSQWNFTVFLSWYFTLRKCRPTPVSCPFGHSHVGKDHFFSKQGAVRWVRYVPASDLLGLSEQHQPRPRFLLRMSSGQTPCTCCPIVHPSNYQRTESGGCTPPLKPLPEDSSQKTLFLSTEISLSLSRAIVPHQQAVPLSASEPRLVYVTCLLLSHLLP